MKIRFDIDRLEEIFITITRYLTRSLLTAFGVFWGIFMLVALMGGSKGVEQLLGSNFEGFATNSCIVESNRTGEAYKGFRKGRGWKIDMDDVEQLRRDVPEINVLSPVIQRWGRTAYFADKQATGFVKGVYPDYADFEIQHLKYGRFINDVDIMERRKVCVIGNRVAEELFDADTDPCGNFIRLDGIYYQIVGVTESTGRNINIGGPSYQMIAVPFSTMAQAYNRGNRVDYLCITAQPGIKVTSLEEPIGEILKRNHTISATDPQAVWFFDMETFFSIIDNLMTGIRLLGWMVGLGTLLAGAIGVSNIMMVTVKERTTEIGIRRAIGARPRDIMNQILSESMVLTSIAGLMGISFAVGLLQLTETAINMDRPDYINFQVTFGLAVGTTLLLLTLGMLAGLAPAYRAMAVKPIDAIHDE